MLSRVLIAIAAFCPSPAGAGGNELEMGAGRYRPSPESAYEYVLFFAANKVGATTCHLTTPDRTFELAWSGDGFSAQENEEFAALYWGIGLAAAQSAMSAPWTVVFDQGLPLEAVAEITFTAFQADDFPPVAEIMSPANGEIITNPDPNPFQIAWSYVGGDPCSYAPETARPVICLDPPDEDELCRDDLPCNSQTFTPDFPFVYSHGTWGITLHTYVNTCFGSTGINVTGGTWVVETYSWGVLVSFGSGIGPSPHTFTVVPTEKASWGTVKTVYQ